MPLTREQDRAILAHKQVSDIASKPKEIQRYRTITRKAQALIRNAGLCQALHFIESKEDFRPLKVHLQEHLKIQGEILAVVRGMELPQYLAATRETLQCLVWQCRMVDSLLGEEEES
jgi:hypothetical protein